MSDTTVAPAKVELEVGYAGKSIPRKEDGRLVQGQGVFADDIKRHGMGYVHFVRAPYAHAEIVASSEARARPILGEVCAQIADVQVRNRGTIGGNICTNDPTNHLPPLLAALGARMTIAGPDGERTVSADEFFEGVYMTAVHPGELLTSVRVPAKGDARDGWASITLGKEGTGIVNVAASVSGGNARIAIGCVAATPVVLTASADETAVRDAVRSANLDPPGDVHASADYRRHLAGVLAARAVRDAV